MQTRHVRILVLLAAATCAVLIAGLVWTGLQNNLVSRRVEFAENLAHYRGGGGVDFQAASDSAGTGIPLIRRWLGDRPAAVVNIPYDFLSDDLLPKFTDATKKLFPEAREIRIMPGEPLIQLFLGGAERVEIARHAERIEICWLEKKAIKDARFPQGQRFADKFPCAGTPIIASPEGATIIRRALLSPESYEWRIERPCLPDFTTKVTFYRDAQCVDMVISPHCGLVWVLQPDGTTQGSYIKDSSRYEVIRGTYLEQRQ